MITPKIARCIITEDGKIETQLMDLDLAWKKIDELSRQEELVNLIIEELFHLTTTLNLPEPSPMDDLAWDMLLLRTAMEKRGVLLHNIWENNK